MCSEDGSQVNPLLGAVSFLLSCIIFLPGSKYCRMSSRKGKHWFQITSYLLNSFPYLCEAESRHWNECLFLHYRFNWQQDSMSGETLTTEQHLPLLRFPRALSPVWPGMKVLLLLNFSLWVSLLGEFLCHWGNGEGVKKKMLRGTELPLPPCHQQRVWWDPC